MDQVDPVLFQKTLVDFYSKIKLYSIFANMLAKDFRNSYRFQRLKREARLFSWNDSRN
jgi:hypothetical protein